MREVSCRAVRPLLEVLEEAGVRVEPLVEGLPVTLDELRDAGQRIDWNVYAVICDRLESVAGGTMTLEDIGVRILKVPSFEFLRHAGRLLVSPRQLYTLANRMVAPSFFPNVTVRAEWLPAGRLVVTGELAPGYRESVAYFRVCHANVVALPRLLDLPASEIEEQAVSGRRGRLILVPPASHTIGAKLMRGVRALRGIGELYRSVAQKQTELEASLAALRTSKHELRQLLERLPEGVLIHRDGIVAWGNASIIASLGYATLEDILGKHILDFLPAEDRAAVAAQMARAAPHQVSDERLEYRVRRPDGTIRRMQAGTTQYVDFDGAPGRLVVVRDVTEHRRMQEQLAVTDRMTSIGTVAAGVAHEINNPLAYVHTSLEVAARDLVALRDPERTARIEASLALAREGTERVRGIVHNLKTLSRVTETDDSHEGVDVPALLDATLALAMNAISAKARVVRTYDRVPPARATRGRLGQVFLNLLLNAADAIPDGAAAQHEVSVRTATDPSGRAVVEISDTGAGIAPVLAARVFEPFFTTKAAGAGTGLGLAICQRIVTELGGEIGFTSAPQGGTTFRVTLPAAPPPAPHAATPPSGVLSAPARRSRVLVVDDEPALLRSVRVLLEDSHQVVTAPSARVALELLREDRSFDAVLADLMMPELTGMDFYDAVSAAYPGLERRIVFMTGGAFTARSHDFLARIPNRCLEKPFDGDQLLAALARLR